MKENITTINISRIDDHVNFEATNSTGNTILMDGSEAIGAKGNGVRPMETLLMGVAGCSAIDVVLILKKMKQDLVDIKVRVEAERVKVDEATIYKTIHLHFDLWGSLKDTKVNSAVDLSMEKYCSVSKILEKSAVITSSYTIN